MMKTESKKDEERERKKKLQQAGQRFVTETAKSAGLSAAPQTGQREFVPRSASLTDFNMRML